MINRFLGDGIQIDAGATQNTIAGNWIGIGTDGVSDHGNTLHGINVAGANNAIGGLSASDRNVISGNESDGVVIAGAGASGNTVLGNYIGTTAAGTGDLGNNFDGVGIFNGATNNVIGGTVAGARNLIAGNNANGVTIANAGTSANRIEGNYIGTDASGAADLGNALVGVAIALDADANVVGGAGAARNVISGNDQYGIRIVDTGTDNNRVENNLIGLNAAGTAAIANSSDGIRIESGGALTGTIVGGTTAGLGNVISGNGGDGVEIRDFSTAATVAGNLIGLAADGTTAIGNAAGGIRLLATSGHTIGGTTVAARNVISGNNERGIYLDDADNNVIRGNTIGTDASGSADPNGNTASFLRSGIYVTAGSSGNLIGGTVAGSGNLISANNWYGVELIGTGTNANTVQGNFIGTNAAGTAALGNTQGGVSFYDAASNNLVGGSTAAARNVIAGSGGPGVYIALNNPTGNRVQGNTIGTDASGTVLLGNAVGVHIEDAASGNLVGGTNAGEGNLIAGSATDGVVLHASAGTGNAILGNVIRDNAGLAIDLNDDGVSTNDATDADGGANATLNYPVLITAGTTGSELNVRVVISQGLAGTTFRVEFFNNPLGTEDPSGHGEARVYLGAATVTTDGSGNADQTLTLNGVSVAIGDRVSATATIDLGGGSYGATSEFSLNLPAVDANQPPTLNDTGNDPNFTEGGVPVLVEPAVVVVDPDSPDFDAGHLIATITANGTAADRLTIAHQGTGAGQVGVSGSNVSYGGLLVGTFTGGTDGSTPLDVTFNADATLAAVQAVTSRLAYQAVGQDPSTLARTVQVTLSDGDGGTSTPMSKTVIIVADSDVWVNTTADVADGNTSSMQALLANRGADGRISLREAILAANNTAGANPIYFSIPDPLVGGAHTITLASALPQITDVVSIDGTLEPDYAGSPIVVIDGNSAVADGIWLAAGSGGSSVVGLVINRFTSSGIVLDVGSDGNTIAGNRIGTDVGGTLDRGNGTTGIYVTSDGNTIGGTGGADRNIISGNDGYGIYISNGLGGGSSNVVTGNTIGLDASGTAALGNTFNGLFVSGNANRIGGALAGEGNVISGNGDIGVRLEGATNSVVQGNRIGTDAGGSLARPNLVGVALTFGAANNLIGGTAAGAGNTIAFNSFDGVAVVSTAGSGNAILGNVIRSNGDLAIDLIDNGVTANDVGDVDSGPNGLLNHPVLGAANTAGGNTVITGTISTSPGLTLRIEFFATPAGTADPSGHGEATTFLGATTVATDGAGEATISALLTGTTLTAGTLVSATATVDLGGGNYGSTSELSANVASTANTAGITVTPVSGLTTTEIGGTAQFTIVLDAPPAADVAVDLSVSDATEGSLSAGTVTFNASNWNSPQSITVTGANDTLADGDVAYTVVTAAAISADANYNGLNAADVALTNTDDDPFNRVTVTTAADTADGDTSSLAALIASRGADGRISLREAITAANNTANAPGGADRIDFAIPDPMVGGVHTISVSSALPAMTDAVVLDASTQPEFLGAPVIVLDGQLLPVLPGNTGLQLQAGSDGSTIRGFVISGFGDDGVLVWNSSNNLIAGNYIGTNATGTGITVRNAEDGIVIGGTSSGNTIGGTTAQDRNLIAGNTYAGINLLAGSTSTTIVGNYVGTDAAGTGALGNLDVGIHIQDSSGNVVGGTTVASRNLIAGNAGDGIALSGAGASANQILGNYVGTDVSGMSSLGNDGIGISLNSGANTNTIGGDLGTAGNLVAGNGWVGISLYGAATNGNTVQGNLVGLNAAGTGAIGNAATGISILAGASGNTIGGTSVNLRNVVSGNDTEGVLIGGAATTGNVLVGNIVGLDWSGTTPLGNTFNGIVIDDSASGNRVGGTAAAERNLIGGNGAAGIALTASAGASNPLLGNLIWSSGQLGIDLGADGVSANDPGDADGGPNLTQNFLVLTYANQAGGSTIVQGTLDAAATTTYRIEFFASAAGSGDPSGHGEAATYLGAISVTTDAGGHADILASLGAAVSAGDLVTATATVDLGAGNYGPTSEFAANVTASATAPGFVVTPLTHTAEGQSTGTFSVALSTAPIADVSVAITVADPTELAPQTTLLVFTPADWSVAQVVTVDGVDDTLADGDVWSTIFLNPATSADPAYDGLNPIDISMENVDDDLASTVVVTTTADLVDGDTANLSALLSSMGADGRISLREAIIAANNSANGPGGADRIAFDIPEALTAGAHVIQPLSALPAITDAIVIDGASEPDYAGVPVIVLDGTLAGAGVDGLVLAAGSDGSTIDSIVVNRFDGSGVRISASDGNTVIASRIGTDRAGVSALGNGASGILLDAGASFNQIGGTSAAERNVVSGNTEAGIVITGASAIGNTVQGNYVGLSADGGSALSNGAFGVVIDFGATGTVIGGTAPGAGNVISGNTGTAGSASRGGIYLWAQDTTIQGNIIGLDATANYPIANGGTGLYNAGIVVSTATGYLDIGGVAAGAGNLIAGNIGDGVTVADSSAVVTLLGNTIFDNSQLGIDLDDDEVTANDVGDVDAGPSGLLNFPLISVATASGGQTDVAGSYQGLANTTLRLEFFLSGSSDPSGHGEGEQYLGSTTIATDVAGSASFAATFASLSVPGQFVTATATLDLGGGDYGATSEFSAHRTVSAPAPVIDLDANDSAGLPNGDFLASFAEDGAPVGIADVDAVLSDPDSTLLASLVASITNRIDGVAESLAADTTGTAIVASFDAGTGTLTLSGADTLAAYQQVLRTVTYSNAADVPDTTTRLVSVVASDGTNSSTPVVAQIVIVATNDAPVLTVPGVQSVAEDASLTFSAGAGNAIAVGDPDAGGATLLLTLGTHHGATLSFPGTSGATLGASTVNGIDFSWTVSGTLAQINAELETMSLSPAANFNGATSIDLTIADNGNSGVGGNLTDTATIAVTVGAVNDPPQNQLPAAQSVAEDGVLVLATAGGNPIAVDDLDAAGPLRVTLTASNGTVTLATTAGLTITTGTGSGDSIVTFEGLDAAIQAALEGLQFTPTPDYNGPAAIQVDSDDLGNTGAGGPLSDSDTLAITVTAVNDPPVIVSDGGGASANINVAENTTAVTTVVATDIDLPAQPITYSIAGGADAARFTIDANSGALAFAAAPDFEAPADAGADNVYDLVVRASDGGLEDLQSLSISVVGVNESPAPTGNASLADVLEDTVAPPGASVAALLGAVFSDPDAGDTLGGIALRGYVANPAQGAWQYSTDGGASWSGVPPVADATALALGAADLLRFLPAADFDGPAPSLSVRLLDASVAFTPGSTVDVSVNGGATGISTVAATLSTAVTSVNDAPNGSDRTVNALEDTPYVLTPTDLGFADPADSPADNLAAVRIDSLPGSGTLALDGTPVVAGQIVTIAQLNAGSLTYTAPPQTHGTALATIAHSVVDDGGTANGGQDTATASNVLRVDVAAIDDPPTIAINRLSIAEGGRTVISATDLAATDFDNMPSELRFTASGVVGGHFERTDAPGTTIVDFTQADVDAALIAFVHDGSETAPGYTLTVSDGTLASAPSAANIDYTPVNEAPVVDPIAVTLAENTVNGTLVATARVTDPDTGDTVNLRILVQPGSDAFAIDAATGQIRVADASQLNHELNPVFSLAIEARDGAGLTSTASLNVTVSDLNEAPTALALARATSITSTSDPYGTVIVSDEDRNETFAFMLVDDAAGRFAIDGSSGEIAASAAARAVLAPGAVYRIVVQATDSAGNAITRAIDFSIPPLATDDAAGATTTTTIIAGTSTSGSPVPPATPFIDQDAAPAPEPARGSPKAAREAPASSTQEPIVLDLSAPGGSGTDSDAARIGAATPASTGAAAKSASRAADAAAQAQQASPTLVLSLMQLGFAPDPSATAGLGDTFADWLAERLAIRRGDIEFSVDSRLADGQAASDDADQPQLALLLSDPIRMTGAVISTGAIWWLARTVGLLTTVMLAAPSWRNVDLLPVVMRGDEDAGDLDLAPQNRAAERDERAAARVFARHASGGSLTAHSIFGESDALDPSTILTATQATSISRDSDAPGGETHEFPLTLGLSPVPPPAGVAGPPAPGSRPAA